MNISVALNAQKGHISARIKTYQLVASLSPIKFFGPHL